MNYPWPYQLSQMFVDVDFMSIVVVDGGQPQVEEVVVVVEGAQLKQADGGAVVEVAGPLLVLKVKGNIEHHDNQHNDTQHNDTQHNNTQHNDTQHNDTQHNDTQHNDTQNNDTQHNDIEHNNKISRHSA